MKKIVLFACVASLFVFYGCKKTASSAPSFTSTQIWDSVGLQYEVKYSVDSIANAGNIVQWGYPDTIIFHANNSITEISDTTITYNVIVYDRYRQNNSPGAASRNVFSIVVYPAHSDIFDSSDNVLSEDNFYKAIFQNDSIAVLKYSNTDWSFLNFYFNK